MKITSSLFTVIACAVALAFTGCSKNETAPTTEKAAEATKEAASSVADGAKGLAEKTSDAAKEVAGKATEAVKAVAAVATNTAAAVTGPFNDGIAAAKKLMAEKDFKGALAELNKLSSLKLSEEQIKIVDALKADIQAALNKATEGAAGAVKGLLGK